ncbi:hypothetical protein K457DRAFT_120090 [Linnemannia elongata AG-77]|uniref:F-box domain-containing protein n=1 Tax=Linnemannia elongata AG-77 TaxID=1314771 RepID=A0A197KJM3_9FUNG|nr:hypothetical protein K457DRAFT_120090 [Linnemannia elongata AG-77]
MPTPTLPTEIILAIVQRLDKPTTLASLRVCREWSIAIAPFVWTTITKSDWHHPNFPIKRSTSNREDQALHPCFQHLQSFEWHSNMYLVRSKGSPNLRRQILPSQIISFLTMAPNLTSLTLCTDLSDFPPSTIGTIRSLKSLNRLDLSLYSGYKWIDIETIFPLLARLEELCLKGTFYYHEKNTRDPLPGGEFWKIKSLTVEPMDVHLARHCPELPHLDILPSSVSMKGRKGALWRRVSDMLQAPTSLVCLKLHSASRGIRSLKGLEYKELSLKPRKGAEVIRLYRWDQDIDIWYQAEVLDVV